MPDFDPARMLAVVIVIFFAIGLHEYAHCKVADMAGDPTPGIYGRVTLNLFKHFEPVGTLMIIITSLTGIGIGWGRPAPINPSKMHNPRWDTFAAVLAGPLTNFLQAIVWGLAFRFIIATQPMDPNSFALLLVIMGVLINLSLCFFNLIPLGVLDGHWIVGQLLPDKPRYYWYRFNRSQGQIILIVLIIGSQMMSRNGGHSFLDFLDAPIFYFFHLLTGTPRTFLSS